MKMIKEEYEGTGKNAGSVCLHFSHTGEGREVDADYFFHAPAVASGQDLFLFPSDQGYREAHERYDI